MPPQTNITEKRIRMSMMLFMHINVRAGFAPAQLARTSLSPALLALALFTTTTTAITLLDNLLAPALLAPASLALALSLTPVSLPKNSVAFSDAFSPNSLASQPPSTFSHLMILPLALASFPKNYIAPSELAASLFCKIFIYQHLIKTYTSIFGKSTGILQTPVI